MCMEDIKIGRNIRTQVTIIPLTLGANTPVATARPNRIAIAFYTNGTNAVRVLPGEFAAGATSGMTMATTRPFLEFNINPYGQIVFGSWNAEAAGGNNVLIVVESMLEATKPEHLVS